MPSNTRFGYLFIFVGAILTFLLLGSFRRSSVESWAAGSSGGVTPVQPSTLTGHAIAPKLGNETAKAELGRATWKYLHTVLARFPENPTPDEKNALQSYIHLFQRLYPCGQCAEHFGQIITQFPPQVSSRNAAAAWGCHVHNEVNKSLKKEIFDCSKIGDFYDCGCAEDEKAEKEAAGTQGKPEMSSAQKEKLTGTNGRDLNTDLLKADAPLELQKEGWQRGG